MDEERIDPRQPAELRRWAEEFGVKEQEILEAIKTAGPMVKDVRVELAKHRSY
jgi:hypothetical protein